MSYHDSINDMPKEKKRGNWKISRKLNTWKVIDKHFVMGILISDSIKKKKSSQERPNCFNICSL